MKNCNTCGCNKHTHCTCNQLPTHVAGYITGELLGSGKMALMQNGIPIGDFPITAITNVNTDMLDAFGDLIPNS